MSRGGGISTFWRIVLPIQSGSQSQLLLVIGQHSGGDNLVSRRRVGSAPGPQWRPGPRPGPADGRGRPARHLGHFLVVLEKIINSFLALIWLAFPSHLGDLILELSSLLL